jgi:hypothetical protein
MEDWQAEGFIRNCRTTSVKFTGCDKKATVQGFKDFRDLESVLRGFVLHA